MNSVNNMNNNIVKELSGKIEEKIDKIDKKEKNDNKNEKNEKLPEIITSIPHYSDRLVDNKDEVKNTINPCYTNTFLTFRVRFKKSDRTDVYRIVICKVDKNRSDSFSLIVEKFYMMSGYNYDDYKPEITKNNSIEIDGKYYPIKYNNMKACIQNTLTHIMFGRDNEEDKEVKGCEKIHVEVENIDNNTVFEFFLHRKDMPIKVFKKRFLGFVKTKTTISNYDSIQKFMDFIDDWFSPNISFMDCVKKWSDIFPEAKLRNRNIC